MRPSGDDQAQSCYLLKTEPDSYSWADLERDGRTVWDGVRNNSAQKHIRDVREGDRAFLYHTGKERQIVGVVRVVSDAYPDPREKGLSVFDIEPVERLGRPLPLAEIKADPAFAGWELVRLPRLSVMPVPRPLWERLIDLSR